MIICDRRSATLEPDSTDIMINRDIRQPHPTVETPRQRSYAATGHGTYQVKA
jgi:hypothetical protein